MDLETIAEHLARSLDDRRLSRSERQALRPWLDELPTEAERAAVRRRAFEIARSAVIDPAGQEVLAWLEDVVKLLHPEAAGGADDGPASEAHFSPGEACPRRIIGLLDRARRRVEVCVFTITDDRIVEALLAAHRRGVTVRIISDNDKVEDEGSDVERLAAEGIPVRLDRTEFHMHHKFAVFDGTRVLTGSYNWTRGAARFNEENLIVTDDRRLVAAFADCFERLWDKLGAE